MRPDLYPRTRGKVMELIQDSPIAVHFSQWGEDVVLWHYLKDRHGGFYVDVGAHHPNILSNTALLHHFNGWTGINVEPNEALFHRFLELRPGDVNLCCGVGAADGVERMAIFQDGAVSSFDPVSVELQLTRGGKILAEWRDVPIRTLRSILDQHLPADQTIGVLNVDAEGWDLVVLGSNDWVRYRPEFVVVEDHTMHLVAPERSQTFQFMSGQGYRLVSHTVATSIYMA